MSKQHAKDAKHGKSLDNLITTDSGWDSYVTKHNRALRPGVELTHEREITTHEPLSAEQKQELYSRMKTTSPGHMTMVASDLTYIFLITKE